MRPASKWVAAPPRGWVLYDADCGFCTRWAWRIMYFAGPRGFHLAPLQAPWVRPALKLSPQELLDELRVLTADGEIHGGADALLYLAAQIPWARPLAFAARLPGMMRVLRAAYRWVARHRHTLSRTCGIGKPDSGPASSRHSTLTHRVSGAHR
jgi:predicted DCC family thiol-disulfide oxidoreductase YuxK